MNEFTQGQRIKVPGSVVRSVSFEKIRQGSLSSRNSVHPQSHKSNKYESAQLYNQIIGKKVGQNEPLNSYENRHKPTVQEMRMQQERKQMKECTFKPKTNVRGLEPRSVNDFNEHQLAYKRNAEDKVKNMRDIIKSKIDKENTFQPNLRNKLVKQKKENEDVHHRLYDDFKKRQQTEDQNEEEKREQSQPRNRSSKTKLSTFSRNSSQNSLAYKKNYSQFSLQTPALSSNLNQNKQYNNIESSKGLSRNSSNKSLKGKGLSITKNMNVRDIYEAKLNKVSAINKEKDKDKSKSQVQQQKNKQIYVKKVFRQMTYVFSDLRLSESEISYLQMSQILQKMNFVEEHNNMDERKHLFEIWQMLQGDTYDFVSLTSLIKVIFCLLGCHDTKIIENCLKMFAPFGTGTLQESEARKLVISQKDSKAIKANFQSLYLNRLNKGEFSIPAQSEQYSFKPFVSKQSIEMAEKYRQKILQESEKLLNQKLIQYEVAEDGVVDHVDLLLLDDKRKELKLRMMREEHEKQKKRLQDEAMHKNHQTQRQSTNENGSSRFNELYQLGKNNLRSKRHEQTQENQRKMEECTFQPNIQKQRESSARISSKDISQIRQQGLIEVNSFRPPSQPIPDFDKCIYRMFEARKRRQNSKKSFNPETAKTREDPSPVLYLNVNMQGCDDVKVPVFNSDTLKTITHKVRVLMGLQASDEEKLQDLIKMQIVPALQHMGFN